MCALRPRKALLPLFFRLRNLKVGEYLQFLRKTQYLHAEKLAELQLAKLRDLVTHAAQTVPYYQEMFARRNIVPEQLRTLDDIKALPILTKERVVSLPRRALLSTRGPRAFAVRKTTGTTGHPVVVLADREAYAWSLAARYRCEEWHNVKMGDRQARLWGRAIEPKARGLQSLRDFALGRRTINANVIDSGNLCRQVQRMLAYRPDYIYGYTSLILSVAEHLAEHPLRQDVLNLKAVICTADKLHAFQKRFLSEVFGCTIVDEYGCSETDILAFECEYGTKHIIAENVVLEVVNQEESSVGEIVVTDLNNHLMPLIRYKLGDLGSICSGDCPCRRGLPILSSIQGRTAEQYVLAPDGRKLHSVVFDYFLGTLAKQGIRIKRFRAVQEQLDKVMLYIVLWNKEDRLRTDSLISHKLAPQLGKQISVGVKYVPRMESSGEKFSFFEPYREAQHLRGRQTLEPLQQSTQKRPYIS